MIPENGGGRGQTPRPSAHFINQLESNGTKSRLAGEVIPRLDAVLALETAAFLGTGLFSLEDVAAGVIKLAEDARRQVLIAEGERELRRRAA